jgi:hypothetical protein
MVMVGVILLLPGICALIFVSDSIQSAHLDIRVVPALVLALLAASAGVMLIRAARRKS